MTQANERWIPSRTVRIRIVLKTSQTQLYLRVLRERKPGAFTFCSGIDAKGRITVPARIRKRLGLEKGDRIRLSVEANCIRRSFDTAKEALEFVDTLEDVEGFSFRDGELEVFLNEG